MSWQDRAECRGAPIDVFYPQGAGPRCNDRALAYCARCPVRRECLDAAIASENGPRSHRSGVRGGMTPGQRHNFAAEQRGWDELGRSWRAWRLERDRIELHREVWV